MTTDYACLLMHGYSGSPFELEPLAEVLTEAGYAVENLCLPGHCRDMATFCKSRFSDWTQAAEDACTDLIKQDKQVIAMGLSMGGSLSLYLAQRYPLAGIVAIATPVFLYQLFPWRGSSPALPLVPLLRYIKPVITTVPSSPEAKQIAPTRGYEGFQAMAPLSSLLKGLRSVRRGLEQVKAPLLVLQSPQDVTVPVENSWEIMMRASSTKKTLSLLPIRETLTTRHVLTTHRETKTAIQQTVLNFVNDIAGQKG